MTISVGIGLAFVAMLCWGFGDFLIQKSTRKIGNLETLFIITIFGSIILLPFIWHTLPNLIFGSVDNILVLLVGSIILFAAAILDFQALRIGKLSVVEPIWSFEIPASAILAYIILGEKISILQIILIILLIIGLAIVSIHEKYSIKKFLIEKGVIISFLAAITMGCANFFVGWGSRVTDPLLMNFFLNTFIAVFTGIYLIIRNKMHKTLKDSFSFTSLLMPMCIFDNAAWIAFAFAMSLAPIAIAVALSESYIIVAVILGLLINKEKIQKHQKFGLILALCTAMILAFITSNI